MIHVVNFGSAKGGLATVGYQLYNKAGATQGARQTSPVFEVGTSTGIYGANIGVPDNWDGVILWDTGEASPRYAVEEYRAILEQIKDESDDIRKIWNSLRNQGELYTKLSEKLDNIRPDKTKNKEYDKDIKVMLGLLDKINAKDYPQIEEIKKAVIFNPEVRTPDYSKQLKELNAVLSDNIKKHITVTITDVLQKVSLMPELYKNYTSELKTALREFELRNKDIIAGLDTKIDSTAKSSEIEPVSKSGELKAIAGNLTHELSKFTKEFSTAIDELEKINGNITEVIKPGKFLQDILSLLKETENVRQLSDDYEKKIKSLRLAGVM